MKKLAFFILFIPVLIALFTLPLRAASEDPLFENVEKAVEYESFLDAIPRESLEFFDEYGIDLSADAPSPGLPATVSVLLRCFVDQLPKRVPLLAVGFVLVLLMKLTSALCVGRPRLLESLSYLAVVSSGVWSFAVIEEMLSALTEVTEQTSSFLTAALPVLYASRVWGGSSAGAAALSGGLPFILTVMSQAVTTVYYPLCWFCYAASLSGFYRGQISLRPVVSTVKRACVKGVEIISGLSVGVFCVQRAAIASADGVARKTVRFALMRMLPLAGNALTDGLETVYACGRSISGRVGVLCVLSVAVLFVTPCLVGLFLTFVYSALSSLSGLIDVPLMADFYADVKDTFAMMTSFAVCSLVVLSSGLLLLTGG